MNKKIIKPINKGALKKLIEIEINLNGNSCSLNHIDISNIKDLSNLFLNSKFDGDISQWNTSHVINMEAMFSHSSFNGNISNWNTSSVKKCHICFLTLNLMETYLTGIRLKLKT